MKKTESVLWDRDSILLVWEVRVELDDIKKLTNTFS